MAVAKAKFGFAAGLESRADRFVTLGQQALGASQTSALDISVALDNLKVDAVKKVAKTILSSKPTAVAYGNVNKLPYLSSLSLCSFLMPSILVLGSIQGAFDRWKEIEAKYSVEYMTATSRAEFYRDLETKYQGVKVIYRHWDSMKASIAETLGRFDEELISRLPSSVQFLCQMGAGYDHTDVNACEKRGIYVSNTPGAINDSTADMNVLLLLAAFRDAYYATVNLRQGNFKTNLPYTNDPQGKVLGILGMGGIGKTVAKRMHAFDMKIVYHNRRRLDPEVERQYHAEYVDFDTLLKISDAISVNVPLSANTRQLLSKREFDKMKDGVIIVNTARGAVINEDDLVDALKSGKVKRCGLDEPHIHPYLMENQHVVLSPHRGTDTIETSIKMEKLVMDNVECALESGRLITPIPEHAKYFQ
ncbi:hypothetical protein BZG36_04948 [Bifiguratus adelaidae]|uniref:Glyoxylate reductase 1 n=1 Tax=Bifiguratus adelaidae TaxID=1938954 RepID=A0A261XUK4_9FUNG|nr:hypothetical protein BZG36_04948 [Bifiguratus adelaidae]